MGVRNLFRFERRCRLLRWQPELVMLGGKVVLLVFYSNVLMNWNFTSLWIRPPKTTRLYSFQIGDSAVIIDYIHKKNKQRWLTFCVSSSKSVNSPNINKENRHLITKTSLSLASKPQRRLFINSSDKIEVCQISDNGQVIKRKLRVETLSRPRDWELSQWWVRLFLALYFSVLRVVTWTPLYIICIW